jgi:hypothetical protein
MRRLCTQQCMACRCRASRHEETRWPIGKTRHRYDWALSRYIKHGTSVRLVISWKRKEVKGAKRMAGDCLRNIVALAKVYNNKRLLAKPFEDDCLDSRQMSSH